jgi:hypothetical protein
MSRLRSVRPLVAIVLAAGLAAHSAPATAHAHSAAAFVDSIGVNTHLTFGGTSYMRFGLVRRRLHQLGVKHVRDGICGGCATKLAQLAALHERDGIRVDAIVGDPGDPTRELRASLRAAGRLGDAVDAVEGANEWDLFAPHPRHWVRQDRAYQARLYRLARRTQGLRHTPVIGPSLVFSWRRPSSWAMLGDLSRHLTYGNSHGYAGGGTPESRIAPELRLARRVSRAKPVYMTEAGWQTALDDPDQTHPATPPDVAAVYVPRLFLANFRAGIRRTYLYELLDHRPSGEATDKEDAFGLVRASGRPKPAFRSLRNLVHVFRPRPQRGPRGATPRTPRTPRDSRTPRITRITAPATVRHLTLRGRDGVTYLALWRPRSLWDQRTRTRLRVARVPATIALARRPRGIRVDRFRPVRSSRGAPLRAARRLTVRVGAAPVILVFSHARA